MHRVGRPIKGALLFERIVEQAAPVFRPDEVKVGITQDQACRDVASIGINKQFKPVTVIKRGACAGTFQLAQVAAQPQGLDNVIHGSAFRNSNRGRINLSEYALPGNKCSV
jgi:hypothetical protein